MLALAWGAERRTSAPSPKHSPQSARRGLTRRRDARPRRPSGWLLREAAGGRATSAELPFDGFVWLAGFGWACSDDVPFPCYKARRATRHGGFAKTQKPR